MSFRHSKLKFVVFYDDEGYGDEANIIKNLVANLVDYLEREGESQRWPLYKGFYKHRDALPGDNKFTWRINVIQRSEYVVLVISPDILKKKWMSFWKEMSQYIQMNRDQDGAILPLVYGVEQKLIHAAMESSGPLASLGLTECIFVPEDYKGQLEWRMSVMEVMRGGPHKQLDILPSQVPETHSLKFQKTDKEEHYKQVLRKKKVVILTSLRTDAIFLAYLEQDGILTNQEVEMILAHPTSADKNNGVIQIIRKRGPFGYQVFMDALLQTSQDYLANQMDADFASQRRESPRTPMIIYKRVTEQPGPAHRAVLPSYSMPSSGDAFGSRLGVYSMSHDPRGRCLIICNRTFSATATYDESVRRGSEHDERNLQDVFEELKFEVIIKKDLTKEEMMQLLDDESKHEAHRNADAFVLVVMSHGGVNIVQGTDWGNVPLTEISEQFEAKKCPALIGKPKAFLIQACQGAGKTTGFTKNTEADDANDSIDMRDENTTFMDAQPDYTEQSDDPVHEKADMLWAMATVSGQKAFRDSDSGSWFICELVKNLRAHSMQDHFLDILTGVCSDVSNRTEVMQGLKQLTEHKSTLRKKWMFNAHN